jgi:hypothetical protein
MKRITNTAAFVAFAALVLAWTEAYAGSSAAVLVDSTLQSARWTTVFTNAVELRWEWPTGAARATLAITGMNDSVATNFTPPVSCWVWQVFGTESPQREDVYDLTLTFCGVGDESVGVLTSRLAVVTGAFGETAVNAVGGDSAWTRVKENAVIPYDAAWTNTLAFASGGRLVITREDGATQTNALPSAFGYYGWNLKEGGWGYGSFDLALTFPGTESGWYATVMRVPEGTMIKMR